jgi:Lipid A 3-O-deacylase (PagL)
MKKLLLCVCLSLASLCIAYPVRSFSAEQAISAGYGFGFLNLHKQTGHIQGGEMYDFFQMAYLYERGFWLKNLTAVAQPWAAIVNRPNDGADVGFDLGIRYYPIKHEEGWSPFVSAGVGMAYTTIGFEEQGTHFLFILQAGVGVRYKRFFIEDTLRHYSNGHTASPNRSVHANIISVGYYF